MPKSLVHLWNAPASMGLASTDFLALAALAACPGDAAPMSALVEAAEAGVGRPLRQATLYAAVDKVIRMRLVAVTGSQRAEQGGRPQRVLSLTETGRLALRVAEGIAESLTQVPPEGLGEDPPPERNPAPRTGPPVTHEELVATLADAGLLGKVEATVQDKGYVVRPMTREVAASRDIRDRVRRAFSGRGNVWTTGNSGGPLEGEPVDLEEVVPGPAPR